VTHAQMAALHEFQSYLAQQAEKPHRGKTGISDAFPMPPALPDDASDEAKASHADAEKAVDAQRAACRSARDEIAEVRAKVSGAS